MHNLAVNGISAHWKYKEPDSRSIMKEDARLRWLREMVELYKEQKSPREFLKNLKTDLIPEEVYVFTPKGRVVTLPIGASALDFAFKIHSEIGFHAHGAKINGRTAPLKTIVKTGDIVEILTSPEKKPRRDWLNMVFTPTARHHIKRWLNQQDRIKNTALGKTLWEKEVKKFKLPPSLLKETAFLSSLSRLTNFRINAIDDFYFLVGSGKIIPGKKFMEKIFPEEKIMHRKDTLIKKVVTKVKKPRAAIQVVDAEGAFVKLAKCCAPIKGEPIVGYITSGKGISAHSLRCPLVRKELLDSQRMVEVSWAASSEGDYQGKLLIRSKDTPGLLAKLTSSIAELKGNITRAEVATYADKKAQIRLALTIQDIKHLERIIKSLSKIKDVDLVKRI